MYDIDLMKNDADIEEVCACLWYLSGFGQIHWLDFLREKLCFTTTVTHNSLT